MVGTAFRRESSVADDTDQRSSRTTQRPLPDTRIRHGELDTSGPSTMAGAHRIFVGDEIATRHNDRSLVTDRGVTVKNRAVWTVDQIHPDGSLVATGKSGTVILPREYVAEYVDLAYARTGMGGQGRTVKGGLLFAERATNRPPQPVRADDPRHRIQRSVPRHHRRRNRPRRLRPLDDHRLDRSTRPPIPDSPN